MTAPDPRGALVWSPFPDEASALEAARTLVTEKLARCGNVLPGVTSVFEWQGAIDTAREVGLLLKTRADLLETAVSRLSRLHPYETPAVLGWICENGAAPTLAWLGELPENS
ncbi:divalent-cation tolerance protein CutA [Novosphingobium profundi]|uniref:divalent-cation tolerance protein CutA n=1 Tax=Novosphingobium profundi TaxID=1774954 RepID=UPI001BDAFD82|nr:divalent-cation tolerance protein CutA [Novosphingobium profundi]MBT0668894.1 divalent-cation tolerance protein CutA [Novosphingobium profundi]